MTTYRLDVPELHRRLDARRIELGLSWRGVGRQTGISPATFTRIINGRGQIEADALVTLLVWLDLNTDLAALVEPAAGPVPCSACGRSFQPNRDGAAHAHNCEPTPA